MSAGPCPFQRPRGELFLGSPSPGWLPEFLGLWQRVSRLCLRCPIALSLWVSVFCLSAQISHKDTSQGPPLIQYDPILTALVCQDYSLHSCSLLGEHEFGGYASQPSTIPSPSSVRVYRVLFPSFYRWRWRRDQSHTPEEEGSTIGHPSLGRDGAAYQLGPGLQPPSLCSFLPAPLQPLPAAGRKQLSLLPC